MNCFGIPGILPRKKLFVAIAVGMVFFMAGTVAASSRTINLSSEVTSTLHYLLNFLKKSDPPAFDGQRVQPFVTFITSPKLPDTLYIAGDSFNAPAAYNEFSIALDLQRIIDYTLDADIPSFVFWPSSLRLSAWTSVEGGYGQMARLRAASSELNTPFFLTGTEHITITPDQNTGAYFSYDVDKMVILSPYQNGKVLIFIQSQQAPSAVGRKGWVLGEDDEWSYLYTTKKGIGLKGLGWADTYMYDSYNVTIYYQPDHRIPMVTYGSVSWVKAGWAGINMVKPKHIHRGLVRVADAFTAVMENPRLPEPAILAETFSKSEGLPTPILKKYTSTYFAELKRRLSSSDTMWKKVRYSFERDNLLDQMTRDEMYAILALDYFKKVLGHHPVMNSHPF